MSLRNIRVMDGAIGTMVKSYDVDVDGGTAKYSITRPDIIRSIHRDYAEAGADIITCNTLTANRVLLAKENLDVEEIVKASIRIAKEVTQTHQVKIAQVIGPCEYLINGDKEHTIESLIKEQVSIGEAENPDIFLVETMYNLKEAQIAVECIRNISKRPIYCSLVVNSQGDTFDGFSVEKAYGLLVEIGIQAFGLNCVPTNAETLKTMKRIIEVSKIPTILRPNLGMPSEVTGEYQYNQNDYAVFMEEAANYGVEILGGCCGTTPDSIRSINKLK